MGNAVVIEKHDSFQVINSLDDLLVGKTYTMLSHNRMLFKNEKGEHVIFRIDPEKKYTKDDYMKLPEGAPYELLNGKLTHMPSPFDNHQNISWNLTIELGIYNKKHKLGIFRAAPFDVHFDKENIAQPDILYVANERKNIIDKWVWEAPDLIVEIHSKSTKKNDKKDKFKLYQKYGVKENWMVDADSKSVEIQILINGKFQQKAIYKTGETLQSDILKGFEMTVDEIFAEN